MKLRLLEKRSEAGDALTLVFQPAHPVTWQAGQYLQYTLPHDDVDDRGVKRWFTISSAPYEGTICITTRFFAKPSSFKHHLHELAVGDEIAAGEPEGDFTLAGPSADYVWIAGGIGITPFHAMLKQAAHDGQKLHVDLLYGNRDAASTIFDTELKAWASANPGLKIHNILEPERITAETIKAIPNYQNKTIYVSGPEAMVEAFEKVLADLGIPKDQQHYDYFPGYDWQPS